MIWTIKTAIGVTVFTLAALLFAQSQSQVGTKQSVSLTGVNIAGADFGDDQVPGIFGQDYFYPKLSSIDYFACEGHEYYSPSRPLGAASTSFGDKS